MAFYDLQNNKVESENPIAVGQHSKATTNNPKDLLGAKKVSISKLPFVAILHGAHAMMNGAAKYGPYNWREKKVQASIYYDAILRHLGAWFDSREELAEDSGVHHLGHLIASAAILLDAMETGNLVDDRPYSGHTNEVLARLNKVVELGSQKVLQGVVNSRLDALTASGRPGRIIEVNESNGRDF